MNWKNLLFMPVGELFRKGDVNDAFWERLEETLLQADAGLPVTQRLCSSLRKTAGERFIKSSPQLLEALQNEILNLLGKEPAGVHFAASGPTVILVVGVNGSGKTTTAGKLAAYFQQAGKKVLLGAADTFRAAAGRQLEIWAERAGAELVKHKDGADPAAVAFDAVKAGAARDVHVVILDTAGRLHTKTPLMEELKKIRRAVQKEIPGAPHETLLVLDAVTGQNAVQQAKMFTQAAEVTGIALAKLDSAAKGGAVLAVREELKLPIKFIGTGESAEDLQPFDPAAFTNALLGQGKTAKP